MKAPKIKNSMELEIIVNEDLSTYNTTTPRKPIIIPKALIRLTFSPKNGIAKQKTNKG